jgi:hypothetical protein
MERTAPEALVQRFEALRFRDPVLQDPPLLSRERHLGPVLEAHLPGEWPGKDLLDRALEAGKTELTKARSAAWEARGDPETPEGFEAGRAALAALLASLPTPPAGSEDPVDGFLAEQRTQIQDLEGTLGRQGARLEAEQFAADRDRYHGLLVTLWEPERGALHGLRDFVGGRAAAAKAAEAMRRPAYRALAQAAARDAGALERLFLRMAATFAEGTWSDVTVELEGRRQRVREILPDGPVLTEKRSWASLGPACIVGVFVMGKDGKPRFPVQPSDWRALALLAELEADAEGAAAHYERYLGALDPEDGETATLRDEVRRRLAALPVDLEALRKWREIVAVWSQYDAPGAFLDAHDPELIGEKGLDDRARQQFRAEFPRILERLTAAHGLLDQLEAPSPDHDPRWATSRYGAAVRPKPHPRAAYAGEARPPPSEPDPAGR